MSTLKSIAHSSAKMAARFRILVNYLPLILIFAFVFLVRDDGVVDALIGGPLLCLLGGAHIVLIVFNIRNKSLRSHHFYVALPYLVGGLILIYINAVRADELNEKIDNVLKKHESELCPMALENAWRHHYIVVSPISYKISYRIRGDGLEVRGLKSLFVDQVDQHYRCELMDEP